MPEVTPNGLLADLMAAFPRTRIDPATVRVYLAALKDLPIQALERAVAALIRTSEWFPTVAAIRLAVAEHTLALPTESEALQQIEERQRWSRLTRESGTAAVPPPEFHPLVKAALDRVGGFPAFRASDDPTVIRGQFGRLYREERARALRNAQTGTLALPPPDPDRRLPDADHV